MFGTGGLPHPRVWKDAFVDTPWAMWLLWVSAGLVIPLLFAASGVYEPVRADWIILALVTVGLPIVLVENRNYYRRLRRTERLGLFEDVSSGRPSGALQRLRAAIARTATPTVATVAGVLAIATMVVLDLYLGHFGTAGPDHIRLPWPWGVLTWGMIYLTWWPLILMGFQFFFYYIGAWARMGNHVREVLSANPPDPGQEENLDTLPLEWKARRVVVQQLTTLFFNGYVKFILVLIALNWGYWMLSESGGGFVAPWAILPLANAVAIGVYVVGPSWAADRQARRRRRAWFERIATSASTPDLERATPLVACMEELEKPLLSTRHGSPLAAAVAVVSSVANTVIGFVLFL